MTNCVKPSRELAYFLGVRQTDGTVFTYSFRGETRRRFVLTAGTKSLPMLQKVKRILNRAFKRRASILKKSFRSQQGGGELFTLEAGIKNIWPEFTKLGLASFQIPGWVANNPIFFGAYLAGIIDGDGDVSVKRPKYPQCLVRITSDEELTELKGLIQKYLNCSCYSECIRCEIRGLPRAKAKQGKYCRLSFVISPKNIEFFKTKVLQHITIKHKKEKLNEFFEANAKRLHSKRN
jgi:hypothetical protein